MMRLSPLIRTTLRRATPTRILDWYRIARYGKTWYEPQGQPVREVFSEIYRRGLWGDGKDGSPFYSGPGSEAGVSEPYVQAVKQFIEANGIRFVVDVGCGDFRVGSRLVRPGLSYHGVDVVGDLIRYNSEKFSSANIAFYCCDVTVDELPAGDLCLIRQVLQHLSNDQVARVLVRCEQYPYIIVTEHLPSPTKTWTPNLDIHHGDETRVGYGSGLLLDRPPFNRAVERVLCEVPLPDQTVLSSVLLVNKPRAGSPGFGRGEGSREDP
jgi:hypothetical protein